jgi:2-aminophenol/2-amino-5-chlorophenol 1,6-dioxygenase alpha subunit
MMQVNPILKGYVLPGLPQPLLTPKANPGYQKLRDAFEQARTEIKALKPDVIVIYSTMWPSVLGHQVQARPELKWVHVDEEFHDLGSIPYTFKMDAKLAHEIVKDGTARGLHMKPVDYHGFPVDTGSVVALKLIDPDGQIPAVILSSNVYADRAETVVLGKSTLQALQKQGKKAVAVIVSSLSNRLHAEFINPKDDKIHSLKDQEWNAKILEFLEKGRLEDVSQLSRQIHKEARVKKVGNFKPFWWLSSLMGSHNRYSGEIKAYEAIYGVGAAVIGLTPAATASRDLEFDEDSPEVYLGERNVLDTASGMSSQTLRAGDEGDEDDSLASESERAR